MKKIFVIIPAIFYVGLIASCKKFIDIPPPNDRLESHKIFENDEAALAALYGLYSLMGGGNLNLLNGGVTLYTALSSDELAPTAPNADADPFYQNSLSADHANLNYRLWRAAYNNNLVFTANAIIDNLSSSTSVSPGVKSQVMGEAKVIRSLGYFYLVNLFGDVPLVTSTKLDNNILMPRTPVNDIYAFIIQDLENAEDLLSITYPLTNRTRINKHAATALLARVYLYQERWQEAEAAATDIISTTHFQLETDLNKVFTLNSREVIWQFSRENSNTPDGATYIPASLTSRPNYSISEFLYQSFELNDSRKEKWISVAVSNGIEYPFPYKYKSRTAAQTKEYQVVFRLAEQFLRRAEARLMQNDLAGSLDDLNTVRHRAGLGDLLTNDSDELMQWIMQEKQHEYFMEGGHRWLDLKRWGIANDILGIYKAPHWQLMDLLYPIPQTELNYNPSLVQNPGY